MKVPEQHAERQRDRHRTRNAACASVHVDSEALISWSALHRPRLSPRDRGRPGRRPWPPSGRLRPGGVSMTTRVDVLVPPPPGRAPAKPPRQRRAGVPVPPPAATWASAPSAPKPGAVVRPTRRRVPGTGGFPDRLEASSAAPCGPRREPRRRRTASCRSRRATGRRRGRSRGRPFRTRRRPRVARTGGQVRRPEKSPPGLESPAGRREPARTRARPFPGSPARRARKPRRGHRRARRLPPPGPGRGATRR